VIDNSNVIANLDQKLDQLAHAALQNQTLSFSTIMKIFTSSSIAENMKIIERDEQQMKQNKQQELQQQQQAQQAASQAQQEMEQAKQQLERDKMTMQDKLNQRDNDTKLQIAGISKMPTPVDNTMDKAQIDLDRKKHIDTMTQKAMELAEHRRSNKANENINMKKATSTNSK